VIAYAKRLLGDALHEPTVRSSSAKTAYFALRCALVLVDAVTDQLTGVRRLDAIAALLIAVLFFFESISDWREAQQRHRR
jgi:divalent metal cation (Fe/Co/Zn/Cd) transporter